MCAPARAPRRVCVVPSEPELPLLPVPPHPHPPCPPPCPRPGQAAELAGASEAELQEKAKRKGRFRYVEDDYAAGAGALRHAVVCRGCCGACGPVPRCVVSSCRAGRPTVPNHAPPSCLQGQAWQAWHLLRAPSAWGQSEQGGGGGGGGVSRFRSSAHRLSNIGGGRRNREPAGQRRGGGTPACPLHVTGLISLCYLSSPVSATCPFPTGAPASQGWKAVASPAAAQHPPLRARQCRCVLRPGRVLSGSFGCSLRRAAAPLRWAPEAHAPPALPPPCRAYDAPLTLRRSWPVCARQCRCQPCPCLPFVRPSGGLLQVLLGPLKEMMESMTLQQEVMREMVSGSKHRSMGV